MVIFDAPFAEKVICPLCYHDWRIKFQWPDVTERIITGVWRMAVSGEPCNFCVTAPEHLGAGS